MPFFLLIASMALAEPAVLPCCEGASASNTLRSYLKVRTELLREHGGRWSGAMTRWASITRHPTGSLSEAERSVYQALYQDIWRLYSTHSRQPIVDEFSSLGKKVAFLVLTRPGGSRSVAEATCGDQYWLQPVDEPLVPLVADGCTPTWVMP